MASTGEPRSTARIGAIFVLLAAIGGGLWWWTHRAKSPASSAVTQPRLGSAPGVPATPRTAPSAPARLAITVTDAHGPLAGATVRLAPRDGEIIAIKTGGDGVARADQLEPGLWHISASAADHAPAALPAVQLAAGADETRAIQLATGGRLLHGTTAEPGEAVAATVTGPDGTYRLTVAEGALLVAAASADYAPQARRVEVGPAGAVADFSLVPGGVIEGVVRDEQTRQPVAGASVVARRDSPAILLAETGARRATSAGDGRFRLGGLGPGAWEVSASDHARHSKAPTIVGIGVAEQVSDVELLVGPGPVIRGRVVDQTGATVPGAALRAFSRGSGAEATADATGAFALEGLRPGDYLVTASSPVHLPAGGARVALADKDIDGVVVTVARGTTLHGHVEPRQPCDIERALDANAAGLLTLMPGVSSGADGAFAIGPLGDGPVRLTARCASGDQGAVQVTVAPGLPDVVLAVTPGATIAGRVVDGEGKPVAGLVVMASEVGGGEHTMIRNGMVTSGVHGLTDAAGAYQLGGLAPGTYQLGALDRGKPLRPRTPPPPVPLAANEHKTGVDLAIDRPSGVISGTVTGPDGKPLADAWVSAHQDLAAMLDAMRGDRPGGAGSRMMVVEDRDGPGGAPDATVPPALTDAQGHYELRGLSRAAYTVVAEAQRGQLRARAANITPNATVDLQALGVTTLSGTVTGPSGPAALFSVELDGPTRAQRSFTDGAFSFGRVDPGSYTVQVTSAAGNGQGKITVTPGTPATLDLTLTANAIVTGTLVDGAGKPVAGLAVALVPDTGDGHLQIQLEGPPPTTGADGRFRLEHGAGRGILLVLRPPTPFTRRGLVLEAGKTLDLGAINIDSDATAAGSGAVAPRPPDPGPRRRITGGEPASAPAAPLLAGREPAR